MKKVAISLLLFGSGVVAGYFMNQNKCSDADVLQFMIENHKCSDGESCTFIEGEWEGKDLVDPVSDAECYMRTHLDHPEWTDEQISEFIFNNQLKNK